MLEREIEKKLVTKIKTLGGKAYKFVSPGNAGVPDRLVVLPFNQIGFAELKRPGGISTPLQNVQLDKLNSLGCLTMVIDSVNKIDVFLERLRKN